MTRSLLTQLPLDILRIVTKLLSNRDLMRLARCCKSLKRASINAKSWTFFPFDEMSLETWKRFYDTIWKSRNVQLMLDWKMESWSSPSYNSHLPAWEPGSDLWRYSGFDCFWYEEQHKKSEDILDKRPEIFLEWKEQNGYGDFDHMQDDDYDFDIDNMFTKFYASKEFNAVWKSTEPAPNSLRAQLMYGGANQLAAVMKQVALAMFGQGLVIRSNALWNANRRITNKNAADEDGEELLCIVPKYKFIVCFNRLETQPIQDIWKHVDLKGTDASSYEDCGMNVQDVEYELECQNQEEWDSDCDCEGCSESEDGVVEEEI